MIGTLIGLGIVVLIAVGWYLFHQRQLRLWGTSPADEAREAAAVHDQRYGGWDAYDARTPHAHPGASGQVPGSPVPSNDAPGWDPHAGAS